MVTAFKAFGAVAVMAFTALLPATHVVKLPAPGTARALSRTTLPTLLSVTGLAGADDFVPVAQLLADRQAARAPQPTPTPLPTAAPAAPASADDDGAPLPTSGSGRAPQTAAPAARPAASNPPALVIGSTQQALINSDRAAAGLGGLSWSPCLAGIAAQNAQRMANQGYISHAGGASASLGCGLGSTGGENVGWWSGGINDGQLNSMFVASSGHYANIVGPYHYVGTAWVVARNGAAYIAVEFN